MSVMTMTTGNRTRVVSKGRMIGMGVTFVILGLLIFAFFLPGTTVAQKTEFGLNTFTRVEVISLPPLILPTQMAIIAAGLICLGLGAYQLVRGFGRATEVMLGLVVLMFVIAFLTWAARDNAFNLTGILKTTLLLATPIALGGFSGVLSERAGVVNIAIEGMMLSSAFMSTLVGSVTGNLYLGLLGGISIGVLMAALHGLLSVKYKVDQIISGVVINILAVGLTSYLASRFLEKYQELNNPGTFQPIAIPLLSRIPIIGPVLFENNLIVYLLFGLMFAIHFMLFYTRWGLRTRAVGEHPKAADTLGINVFNMRYINVLLSGAVAGVGGAYFTIGSVGRFDEVMTAGKGYIGLAAMIFGKWTPFGAFGASLIFGFADSLQTKLQILNVPIPSEFLLMAPYLATIIAVAGVIGRATPPAADGIPYEK
ncbi:MAG: ABC transporter permease [Anaerolineae bacterium]|nr:ABC transporter permease [Anaerolineae bacterium]